MGQSTQHHRFRFASVVVLVSARGSASPRAGAGELYRQCFASVSQCAGAQRWCRLACASCWISHSLRLGLANRGFLGSCGAPPLRPPAALVHNAAFQKVQGSRCAKASLGAPHRCAPSRVSKTGLMQSGLRWIRSHSRRRSPVAGTRPTRRRLHALVVCLHRGIAQALRAVCLVSGLWPVVLCVPPPTLWPRRCAALARAVCPSTPQGGSLSRAPSRAFRARWPWQVRSRPFAWWAVAHPTPE